MLLKRKIKEALPKGLLLRLAAWKRQRRSTTFLREWNSLLTAIEAQGVRNSASQRLLIVPPDPGALFGALGDDAMVTSIVEVARSRNPSIDIHVLTGQSAATDLALLHGMTPIQIWEELHFVKLFHNTLIENNYHAVIALGADIMDAYHDFHVSARMIACVDIAGRMGIPASVFGFSFNNNPHPDLAQLFDRTPREVFFNLRDSVSYLRFSNFTHASSRLVADTAFCLSPGIVPPEIEKWIATMRASGKKVIGFNVHPMLFRDANTAQLQTIVQRSQEAIISCTSGRDVAWLLLPHDYRGEVGDSRCLLPLYHGLLEHLGSLVNYLDGKHRAATLKAVSGRLDGVVAARMHLAIATLGMGVPTLCITYQDKFEGLFRHFELPETLLLDPADLLREDVLAERIQVFLSSISTLRDKVATKRASVLQQSLKNFAILDYSLHQSTTRQPQDSRFPLSN